MGPADLPTVRASHPDLGNLHMSCEASAELLFCDNETNNARVFGIPNVAKHVKDGINDYVVAGDQDAAEVLRANVVRVLDTLEVRAP